MTEIKEINNTKYKLCSKCKKFKTLLEFQKRQDSKDGYRDQCITCLADLRNKRAKQPANITYKICSKCGRKLNITNFTLSTSSPDGYNYRCKDCIKQYQEQTKEQRRQYNIEYCNREDVKQRQKIYHILYNINPKLASEKLDYYINHSKEFQKIYSNYLKTTKSATAKREKEEQLKQTEAKKLKQEQERLNLFNKGYKICSLCGNTLKLTNFNKRVSSIDGLDNACRFCRTKRTKEIYKQRGQVNIKEKSCSCCGKLLPVTEFYFCRSTVDGYRGQCKSCTIERDKIRQNNLTPEQKEKRKQYHKEYAIQNKEKITMYQKLYKENNKDKIKESEKLRYSKIKINKDASVLINKSLKGEKLSWYTEFNYSLEQLKEHLESQFTPEMSWDNYGTYWELDHIIPQRLFKMESRNDKDFKLCWSLMNLRPLTKIANRQRPRDGSDIPEELKQQILNQKEI